jgi:competence protein ComEA
MKVSVFIASLFLSSTVMAADPININAADAVTLDTVLAGIGMKKAEAIVQYRDANGPFKSLDDLNKVPGIGPSILEANREKISFGEPAPAKTPAAAATTATPAAPAATAPAATAPTAPAAPVTPATTPASTSAVPPAAAPAAPK